MYCCCNGLPVLMSSLPLQFTNPDTSYLLPSFIPALFWRPLHAILILARRNWWYVLHSAPLFTVTSEHIFLSLFLIISIQLHCFDLGCCHVTLCISFFRNHVLRKVACWVERKPRSSFPASLVTPQPGGPLTLLHWSPMYNLPRPNTCIEVSKYYVLLTCWHWW